MQTFLPFPNFAQSAKSLDYRRLGKQRVEAKQIYFALTKDEYGWKNHPAVKMWKGYEDALLLYGFEMCTEWRMRGYKDTQRDFFLAELGDRIFSEIERPKWLGREDFHRSHQSNLLRKDYSFYSSKFTDVPDNLPYVWCI